MAETENAGGDGGIDGRKPTGMQRCCNSLYLTCRQFLLLLGKNFLLQVHLPLGSLFSFIRARLRSVENELCASLGNEYGFHVCTENRLISNSDTLVPLPWTLSNFGVGSVFKMRGVH